MTIVLDVGVGHFAGGAGPRVVDEAVEPLGDETVPPSADGGVADMELGRDNLVAGFVGTGQDDAGAEGEPLGTLGSVGPGGEFPAFVVGEGQFGLGPCHGILLFGERNGIRSRAQGYSADFRLRTLDYFVFVASALR